MLQSIPAAKFLQPVLPDERIELRLQFTAMDAAKSRASFQGLRDAPSFSKGRYRRVGAGPAMNDWRSHKERSTPSMVRLIVRLATTLPAPVRAPLLYPIVAYFLLTSPTARAASRDYLRRVLDRAPGWRDLWRHFFAFASCTLDRIFLLSKRHQSIEVDVDRPEEVRAAVARKTGCLLFVAHFGSAESLRLIAVDRRGLPLSILLDRKHGRMLTELLEELNPELAEQHHRCVGTRTAAGADAQGGGAGGEDARDHGRPRARHRSLRDHRFPRRPRAGSRGPVADGACAPGADHPRVSASITAATATRRTSNCSPKACACRARIAKPPSRAPRSATPTARALRARRAVQLVQLLRLLAAGAAGAIDRP